MIENEVAIVETVAGLDEEAMRNQDRPTVTGTSGTVYHAVNFLDMSTRHKNAVVNTLQPVLPLILTAATKLQGTLTEAAIAVTAEAHGQEYSGPEFGMMDLAELLRGANITELFAALLVNDADLKLAALLYMPKEYRFSQADAEPLKARMDDMMDLSYREKYEVFRRFFSFSMSFCRTAFVAFIQEITAKMQAKTPTS